MMLTDAGEGLRPREDVLGNRLRLRTRDLTHFVQHVGKQFLAEPPHLIRVGSCHGPSLIALIAAQYRARECPTCPACMKVLPFQPCSAWVLRSACSDRYTRLPTFCPHSRM